MAQTAKKTQTKGVTSAPISHAVGRRKAAVARVWLRRGNGKVTVNGKPFTDYFTVETSCLNIAKPLETIKESSLYNFDITVEGGGYHSQSDAVKLGISRALLASDEGFRSALRQEGLLTVDARVKERKKFGQRGARRKFQFVKR